MSETENKQQELKDEDIKKEPPIAPFDYPAYKKKLEERLDPLDIEEFLKTGNLTQTVILKQMKDSAYSVTFTSINAGVDSVLDRVAKDYIEEGESYTKVLLLLQLASSIKELNGKPLGEIDFPEYSADKEEEYLDLILKRFKFLREMNLQFVSILSLQFSWFIERVGRFLRDEFVDTFENF